MTNTRFQNALKREPQAVPPIWFMRQAGRYHAHYQNLRAKHSFMELCKDPSLAAQVTLGPIADFDFDVAILFSDLLFPLDAMGMGLSYESGPPTLSWHLNDATFGTLQDLAGLGDKLDFQQQALLEIRRVLPDDKSLIGFIGGPWTLFAYAVEGGHKGGLKEAKRHLHLFSQFCEVIIPILRRNIELQLEGGAEVVMIFDTAAGELAPTLYHQAVLPALAELVSDFDQKVGYYAKGIVEAHLSHNVFEATTLAGLGVDHRWDLPQLFKNRSSGFVQGNFDQDLLFLEPQAFEKQLLAYLSTLIKLTPEERAGFVCGLGHGVLPQTPQENVRTFVQKTRELFSE
ncbi:uroporphyrinogen decarboxylase [Oligoflexia bacterium]|nr:uroporphyrinogen decarboxylase [Oligoflexia bacterium]